jgi:hypothetical protein
LAALWEGFIKEDLVVVGHGLVPSHDHSSREWGSQASEI